jgi:hypothetical protein
MRYLCVDSNGHLWFRTRRPPRDTVPVWIEPIFVGSRPNIPRLIIDNIRIETSELADSFNLVERTAREVAGKLQKMKMAWK